LNKQIAGISLKRLMAPAQIVGIFESVPGTDQVGGPELLPKPGRHMQGNNITFADGHVKRYKDGNYAHLFWKP
jgi:prepilin-type processing-associated H-X9-DG protein